MIKRKLVIVFMSILLVLSLTACKNGSKQTSEPDTEDKKGTGTATDKDVVEINFYEHSDNEAIAKALVEAYNAQSSHVKVNLSIIANDDYDDKIKVMLSGGGDIDCFWVRGGPQTRQLADSGALLSLNDFNAANQVDITKYGDLGQAFEVDDKVYGLSTSKSCWLLWYNKDLFDAAGLEYPVNLTWEEYTKLAKSLTTDDLWGAVVPNWTMNLGASAAGEYLTDDALVKTREYANFLERWYVTDKSHPSIEEMSGSFDINSFFAEGKTYMMINGDWTFLIFPDTSPEFTWCAAPLPVFDGAAAESTVGSTSCFSISSNSKYPEEAYDFIKFACYSDEGASIYAKNSAVPAFPSEEALAIYKEKVTVPGAEYVFSANVGMEQGPETRYEELNTAYKEELNDALVGNSTLDKAFDKYIQRRNEINAK